MTRDRTDWDRTERQWTRVRGLAARERGRRAGAMARIEGDPAAPAGAIPDRFADTKQDAQRNIHGRSMQEV